MGRRDVKSYLNLEQAIHAYDSLKIIIECIDFAIKEMGELNMSHFLDVQRLFDKIEKDMHYELKQDLEFKERINKPQISVLQNVNNDRKYTVETIKLNEFSREHNRPVEEATIHIGMNADEYARSYNAFAVTIGTNIFFRNGAYKPETEEGRSLLAHELTHVSQNRNKEEYRNTTREELESEAEAEETKEKYNADPEVLYDTGIRQVKMRKSVARKIDKMTEQALEDWLERMKFTVSEEEYLDLLCKYQKYMERVPKCILKR